MTTTPDTFASADDAAAYGFTLPANNPAGVLAQATQAIRDEAGIPITQTTSTAEIPADCGKLAFPGPLVTSVISVQLIGDDDTLTEITGWRFDRVTERILLPGSLPWYQRYGARYQVTYVHGFAAPLPAALVMLTGQVAQRLGVTPAAATVLASKTVGSVSWTVGNRAPVAGALTEAECSKLARIVPLRRVRMVTT